MKNFKKGFSLAELLIALAIISIVAIMGYSITKKSTEKAYNLYIYSGYHAIQGAIADANSRGYSVEDCKEGKLSGENTCAFVKHIQKLLEVSDEDINDSNPNFAVFRTFNNIKYIMNYNMNYNDGTLLIKMSVPTTKKKINNTLTNSYTFSFLYAPNKIDCIVPFTGTYPNGMGEDFSLAPTNNIDLTKRIDLLPFYIDDGMSGRVIQYYKKDSNTFETKEYSRRNYYSFYDAFVRSRKADNYSLTWPGATINLNTNGNSNADKEPGVMRVANPRKVF